MKTTLEAEPKRDPRKIHETLWKCQYLVLAQPAKPCYSSNRGGELFGGKADTAMFISPIIMLLLGLVTLKYYKSKA